MSSLLVVDDEPGIRESLEYYFSSQGHQIQCASGLPEALELAAKSRPDAIVSDLMFEGGTGLMLREELGKRVKGYNPGFILMSGKATLDAAVEAMKHGIDRLLLKPLDLEELSEAIDSAVQKRVKIRQDLKVKFQLAEQFYHDLSLPFNLLLPKLCMLLDGQSGELNMAQMQSLSGQLEHLRRMLWVMKGFYPRLLEGKAGDLKRNLLDANHLVVDTLTKFESQLYGYKIDPDFVMTEHSQIEANREAAEALIEIVLTRALAIAEQGSRMYMDWSHNDILLTLRISLGGKNQSSRANNIAPLIQMVPLSLTSLERAGLSFDSESPSGPWRIGFNLEKI